MKTVTEAYVVLRSTLMPSGDRVQILARPSRRSDQTVTGPLEIYCSLSEAPSVVDRLIVTVEVDVQHKMSKTQ